jgi:hypothetical protein
MALWEDLSLEARGLALQALQAQHQGNALTGVSHFLLVGSVSKHRRSEIGIERGYELRRNESKGVHH